ncbi:MAG: hypothetical protein AB2721_08595, partial [Candidatus Thiodiazotropha sp.]
AGTAAAGRAAAPSGLFSRLTDHLQFHHIASKIGSQRDSRRFDKRGCNQRAVFYERDYLIELFRFNGR